MRRVVSKSKTEELPWTNQFVSSGRMPITHLQSGTYTAHLGGKSATFNLLHAENVANLLAELPSPPRNGIDRHGGGGVELRALKQEVLLQKDVPFRALSSSSAKVTSCQAIEELHQTP